MQMKILCSYKPNIPTIHHLNISLLILIILICVNLLLAKSWDISIFWGIALNGKLIWECEGWVNQWAREEWSDGCGFNVTFGTVGSRKIGSVSIALMNGENKPNNPGGSLELGNFQLDIIHILAETCNFKIDSIIHLMHNLMHTCIIYKMFFFFFKNTSKKTHSMIT